MAVSLASRSEGSRALEFEGSGVGGLGIAWTPKNLPVLGFLIMISLYGSLKR